MQRSSSYEISSQNIFIFLFVRLVTISFTCHLCHYLLLSISLSVFYFILFFVFFDFSYYSFIKSKKNYFVRHLIHGSDNNKRKFKNNEKFCQYLIIYLSITP